MKRERTNEIMPLQPFMVLHTSGYKRKVEGKYGISHFYEFTADANTKKGLQAVPDGSVDLLFGISDSRIHTYIGGTVLKAKDWDLYEGNTYFGVRFLPGQGFLPADVKIDEIINTDLEIKGDVLMDGIAAEVAECTSMEERSEVFLKHYGKKSGEMDETSSDRCLEHYLRKRIYESKGGVSISRLAEETAYSECYLRRVFKKTHGISPKSFEKFVRFQNVLGQLTRCGDETGLEEIALENGYYDQSHMINEFKSFAGITPENYQKMVSGTQFIRL